MSSICAREQMEQFAPFWASVAQVASTLVAEPTREYVQRLVRDIFSQYRYHPDSFMDMYVVRADPDEQLRESETFDALRDKIRQLAGELYDAATGLRACSRSVAAAAERTASPRLPTRSPEPWFAASVRDR